MLNEQQPNPDTAGSDLQPSVKYTSRTPAGEWKRSIEDALSTAAGPVVEVHADDSSLVIGHAESPPLYSEDDSDDLPSYPESSRPQRSEYDAWLG
jgi:hypothetical protein